MISLFLCFLLFSLSRSPFLLVCRQIVAESAPAATETGQALGLAVTLKVLQYNA